MKFKISRASDWNRVKAPVEEAVCINPTETRKYRKHWEIEINTLEELIALSDREDTQLIIDKENITVYDDYVE